MARFTKSRLFLAAALPLLAPSLPAHAQQNPNQRAEAEARAMLPKCQQPDRETQQICLRNHRDFIREYVRAKAGSEINIRGVASYLRPLPPTATDLDRQEAIGIPPNLFESCAWRFWHAMMPTAGEDPTTSLGVLAFRIRERRGSWQPTCLQLDVDKRDAALSRAVHLLNEYHANPARMPPSDWQPRVAGLVEPKPDRRFTNLPAHCLDGRSVPLRGPGEPAPDIPAFVPPKGCPNRP